MTDNDQRRELAHRLQQKLDAELRHQLAVASVEAAQREVERAGQAAAELMRRMGLQSALMGGKQFHLVSGRCDGQPYTVRATPCDMLVLDPPQMTMGFLVSAGKLPPMHLHRAVDADPNEGRN